MIRLMTIVLGSVRVLLRYVAFLDGALVADTWVNAPIASTSLCYLDARYGSVVDVEMPHSGDCMTGASLKHVLSLVFGVWTVQHIAGIGSDQTKGPRPNW
jgi:hypothetical protein